MINAVRTAQKLPALKRAKPRDEVAQAQAVKFARTGTASHGSSITDIAKRFAAKGYHSAAYDEGFDFPAPLVRSLPVEGVSSPAPNGGTLGIRLKCAAKVPCTLTATMTLPDAKATATRRAR